MPSKTDSETWPQFIARLGKLTGMKAELTEAFHYYIDMDHSHEDAALMVMDDFSYVLEDLA